MFDLDKTQIVSVDLETEMKKSFMSYAMTVIISRALPDVRDGLKPVHRRILYSMSELGVTPDKPFRKSARIVGDVLGKYHPHGEGAIYDSLVRMAQDFSLRNPLVEGHGNFGSIDGDGAAAMRYTEARLSKIAMEMVTDIDKETVDYYPNFDETLMQPKVLPARYPNLLVNGSNGIAVGMATNILPHNLGEVIEGTIAMIDNPGIDSEALMQYIKGPDFPTAGIVMGHAGIRAAFRTGRGRIVCRARTEIEENGNRQRIVVTELPYQVNKARLIEKMAEMVQDKRLEGISGLNDESDRNGMRVVIDLKRDANPNIVLNQLFKHTQMQESYGVIMLALVDGNPKVLTLQELLYHYLQHQREVVTRRTQYDLEKARAAAHIREGLLIALDFIDEVIALIRASQTTQIAKDGLMERFNLSEKQAQAILDMRLQRLTGLERDKIQAEYRQLLDTIAYLSSVLESDSLLMSIIREELLAIRVKYADERRTEICPIADEIDIEDLIEEQSMVVTLTHFGYIKRTPSMAYRTQNRGGRGITGLTTRDEDMVRDLFVATTHTPLMFFTNRGRAFKIKCYEIPEAGRQARGTAIVNLLQLAAGEKITAVIPLDENVQGGQTAYLVMATCLGIIKKTDLSDFSNIHRGGLIAVKLREDDELIGVRLTDGQQELLIGTQKGMSIRFHESDVRAMGRAAQGVRSIDLADGDCVVELEAVRPGALVLAVTQNGYGKRTVIDEYRLQTRGGKGVRALLATEKTGPLVCLKVAEQDQELIMISSEGTIIRIPVQSVPSIGRSTQGVRLMRMPDGERVVSVACAQPEEAEDADAAAEQPMEATTEETTARVIQMDELNALLDE